MKRGHSGRRAVTTATTAAAAPAAAVRVGDESHCNGTATSRRGSGDFWRYFFAVVVGVCVGNLEAVMRWRWRWWCVANRTRPEYL